ncbi:MAG TPA: CHASE2 domain-containing protein, partial [Arthrobacter sp.]
MLITLGICLLGVYKPAALQFLDYRVFDAFAAPAADAPVSALPVIVDIDERSLKSQGRWPWPRHKVADLVERIDALGPLAIALDIMFPEPETPVVGDDTGSGGDRRLANALTASEAVLGFQFQFETPCEDGPCLSHPLLINTFISGGVSPLSGIVQACGAVCSLADLSQAGHSSGFFNISPDQDGLLRSVPLLIGRKGEAHPSLALSVWMKSMGGMGQVTVREHAGAVWLQAGGKRIPVETDGRMRLAFRGEGRTFPYVSADDVLSGRVQPEHLKGKIVFVGTSAAGLKEFRSTPTDPIFPGVEVHATVLDNIIRSDHSYRPSWAPGLEMLVALLTGLAAIVVVGRTSAVTTLLFMAAAAAVLWGGASASFGFWKVILSPILPLVVLTANFLGLTLMRFWRAERQARERTRELALAQQAIIESMASLTETRDPETGGHIKRTQHYVRILADALRDRARNRSVLSTEDVELLYTSAPLHDIGKVGVPDHILLKPGKLTGEEFEIMKRHTEYGRDAILAAMKKLANGSYLQTACDIAYTHHERWDGNGYPLGLSGVNIPLSGRLMALADTYDALTSRRVYKPPMSHDSAARVIVDSAGSHFDPTIVEAFLGVVDEFRRVATEH